MGGKAATTANTSDEPPTLDDSASSRKRRPSSKPSNAKTGATGIQYVIWKGGWLHYKRRWPTDVRKAHPALREFMEGSLDTCDLRDATSLASEWNLRFDAACERYRAPSPIDLMKRAIADRSIDDHDRLKYGIERILGPEFKEAKPGACGGSIFFDTPSKKRIRPTASRAIQRIVETFSTLAQDLSTSAPEGERAHRIREFEAWKQRCIIQAKDILELLQKLEIDPEEVGLPVPEPLKEKTGRFSLVQIAEKWGAANQAPQQHINQYLYACRLFSELHSGLQTANEISALHISEFEEQVARMPASTRREIRAAKMLDAIAIGEKLNLPKINKTTVNKHLSAIKTVIKWGFTRGFINENVGDRIHITKTKKTKKPRRDLKTSELHALINAIVEHLNPTSDDFWIPIIALLHGARREEICQLEKTDIENVAGIWCMNIRDFSGSDGDDDDGSPNVKSVKSANSRRLVPLHQQALRMGFVAYALASPNGRVFASLAPDKRGDFGGPYGKRFARVLRKKAKITDKRVTFHSLRHSFITACRNADMPESMEQTLSGHAGSDAIHDGYGARQAIPNRKEWIDRIDFGCAALDELVISLESQRPNSTGA